VQGSQSKSAAMARTKGPERCMQNTFMLRTGREFAPVQEENIKMMKKLAIYFLPIVLLGTPSLAQKTPPLRYLQSIPMPDLKAGDFDHFAIDLAGSRLFLTAEDNSLVEVFDLKANKLIHTIKDVDTPHSMLYLPESKQLWVVCGGDGTLKIFNADTYAVTDTIKLAEGADSSIYDPAKHLFYVVTGGEDAKLDYSMISIVDTTTRKRVGDIKVDSGNIEALAFEKNGSKLFANVRDKKSVGVFDRDKKTPLATWTLGDLTGNTPMAYDDASHRLFVVGRKPANLVVLNADSGKIVATLPAAEMVDDMAFDPQSKRIYVACGGFTVVYQERDADHYEELGRVPTGFRAKTAFLAPQLKRFYVAAPRDKDKAAEVKIYELL
jgi:DNA-binding beta-propeller fold protein YncE